MPGEDSIICTLCAVEARAIRRVGIRRTSGV
jgi:hypothetical protein